MNALSLSPLLKWGIKIINISHGTVSCSSLSVEQDHLRSGLEARASLRQQASFSYPGYR